MLYKFFLKPILFRFDPERVHDFFTAIGERLGASRVCRTALSALWRFDHSSLEQTILGINFKNPIGLAAGFDKNARLTKIMPCVGFGFEEAGSITGEPCVGNPKPRLWRLPKSRALVVYYGLKNDGCDAVVERLRGMRFDFPLGVSIAKTNNPGTCDTERGIWDYEKAFRAAETVADYITVNISCPNAFGGEPFSSPERLEALLNHLDRIETSKPIFLKLSVDMSNSELDNLVAVAVRHRVHGLVASNLTKIRERKEVDQSEIADAPKGGISGKPTFHASNEQIKHLYKTVGNRFVIIGCGGVFCAQDAYEKIKCGASLVQLITGMIFEGPQLIGDINLGLVELLKKDGFDNIKQAIGSSV
jgi:dihydroorotate dehydrogenase subfamily 2